MKPKWVPKAAVLAIHELLLAEHGGAPGLLSDDLLEACLASPRNLLAYGKPDLHDLAAKYAFALSVHHPFHDGNKRVALTVAGVFLELNGRQLVADEADAVAAIMALTTRRLTEPGFAKWLRVNTTAPPRRRARTVRKSRRAR